MNNITYWTCHNYCQQTGRSEELGTVDVLVSALDRVVQCTVVSGALQAAGRLRWCIQPHNGSSPFALILAMRMLVPFTCAGWEWVDWDKFLPPDQVFEPLKVIRRQGYNPFAHHAPGM